MSCFGQDCPSFQHETAQMHLFWVMWHRSTAATWTKLSFFSLFSFLFFQFLLFLFLFSFFLKRFLVPVSLELNYLSLIQFIIRQAIAWIYSFSLPLPSPLSSMTCGESLLLLTPYRVKPLEETESTRIPCPKIMTV